jgi:hypothetical protein
MCSKDIEQHGLRFPIVLLHTAGRVEVLDGCSRLDAMEMVGLPVVDDNGKLKVDTETIEAGPDIDPKGLVVSLNLRRRHLAKTERDEVIKALANTGMTDRAIARRMGLSPTTVGKSRAVMSENGHKPDRVETSGRKARGRKPGSGGKHQSPGAHRALPGQERNEAIGVIKNHLARDPAGFLSDIAAIMLDETARLGRVSEYKRRETLEKIGRLCNYQ